MDTRQEKGKQMRCMIAVMRGSTAKSGEENRAIRCSEKKSSQ